MGQTQTIMILNRRPNCVNLTRPIDFRYKDKPLVYRSMDGAKIDLASEGGPIANIMFCAKESRGSHY